MDELETLRTAAPPADSRRARREGLVCVWSVDRPCWIELELADSLTVGRSIPGLGADRRLSRSHFVVERADEATEIREQASVNRIFVNVAAIERRRPLRDGDVVRAGETVFMHVHDLDELAGGVTAEDGVVWGPKLRRLAQHAAQIARSERSLLVEGPIGAGKELVARGIHRELGDDRPFTAVDAGRLADGELEALLFAADEGLALTGGTLFVDEVGELAGGAQAELLRLLDRIQRAPVRADLRLCFTAHVDLRAAVTRGEFREDLFFRIQQPAVVVPPLLRRREEVPALVDLAVRPLGLTAMPELVEHCTQLAWPGNVRELLAEVAAAGRRAQLDGRARVEAFDLRPAAGRELHPGAAPRGRPRSPHGVERLADAAHVEAVLRRERGNLLAASRELGVHRTQLRRWISKHNIDIERYRAADDER